jgi:hypothetical protein
MSMSRPIGRQSSVSRRELVTGTAAAALASPPILAQARAPLKLGVLNSYTGAIAVAADSNVLGMQVYLYQLDDRRAQGRADQGERLLQQNRAGEPDVPCPPSQSDHDRA